MVLLVGGLLPTAAGPAAASATTGSNTDDWKLNSVGAKVGSPSSLLAAATAASTPGKPTVTSFSWGDGTATLNWNAPNNDNITDYDYQTRNQTDGGSWTEYDASNTSTETNKTFTLANGKVWRLRVRAGNRGRRQ